MSVDLRSLTLHQVRDLVVDELGLPRYRAEQIFSWVHGRGVPSTEPMTNLAKALRGRLADLVDLTPLGVDRQETSVDGTVKLRLACKDGALIETVLIPHEDRLTQCVSSQVGCRFGCRFCATATMGFVRQLTPGEIVDQVYRARALLADDSETARAVGGAMVGRADGEPPRISNLVFMGMGEPLDNLDAVLTAVEILRTDIGANFSPRRITLSTAGLVPGIEALGARAPELGLAVSLHATTDEVRDQLIPLNRRHNLAALFAALRAYPLPKRRRITFEYMMIAELNDRVADARMLPRLLDRIPAKINLLPYNPSRSDRPRWKRPSDDVVEDFAELLREKGINTTVRQGRGLDIQAACGQLAVART